MCAQSSGTMRFVYNGGVSSQTSTQILARVQTVLAVKPDVVVIQAGTNDPPASIPTATTLSNIQNMISAVLAAGAIPYLVTLPPRSDTSVMSAISAINDGIQNLALSNGVPIYRAWRSVNDGTNHYISGASSDNIHPYTEILPFEGAAAYTAFVSQMGAILADSMRFDMQGGALNKFANGLFLTDSNSDGVADGVAIIGGTGSITTATYGKAQRCSFTANAAASGVRPSLANITVGRTYRVRCKLKLSCTSGTMLIVYVNGSASSSPISASISTTTGFSLRVLSGTTTSIQIDDEFVATGSSYFTVYDNSSGATGYIEMSELEVFDLTANGQG